MKIKFIVLTTLIMCFTGCSSIQETYKPLYQVKPEKTALKVEKK